MGTVPWHLARTAVLGLVGCVLLPLAGGCGKSLVVDVKEPEFRSVVLESDLPVLVDFYKDECPICLPVGIIVEDLAKEYQGRVKVARFMAMTGYWWLTSKKIKEEYDLWFVPIVILFDKGVPVKRWVVDYSAESYRKGLNELLAKRASATQPDRVTRPGQPTTRRNDH